MSEDKGRQDMNSQPGTDVTRPSDTDQDYNRDNATIGPTKIWCEKTKDRDSTRITNQELMSQDQETRQQLAQPRFDVRRLRETGHE
jgi:hypothetical protein